jgi:FtsH-binding integral membrane protein
LQAQVGFAYAVSALLMRPRRQIAILLFLIYAAVNGLWIASIILLYGSVTLDSGLYTAAGMFLLLAVLVYVTKIDLLKAGSLFLMVLVGGLVVSGTNFVLHGSIISLVVNVACVAVFISLLVYDRERLTWLAIGVGGRATHLRSWERPFAGDPQRAPARVPRIILQQYAATSYQILLVGRPEA